MASLFKPSIQSLKPLVNKLSQRRLLDDLALPSPDWVGLDEIDLKTLHFLTTNGSP